MPIETVNPTTGERVKRFKPFSRAAVEAALAQAQRAFERWRRVPLAERSRLLSAAAALLRREVRRHAELITLEMGKPITQAVAEVEKCAWACEHFAANAAALLADEPIATEARRSVVEFAPLGAVLAVMPWNFPYWQVFRFAAPALMAGNVGVLKHASNVPQCALAIEQVFRRAGFPAGTFRTLLIESGAVAKVIADDRIVAVTLTGSEDAGSRVAAVAGQHLKKTVLELGGSDPFVVLRDADLDRCSVVAAQARTINSGQSCIAAKRFIVDSAVAKEFTRRFVAQMGALRTGDPMDEATQVGPQARADLLEDLDRQVRQSLRRGARLLLGGKRVSGRGYFYPPTVLGAVRPGMPAFDEEVFGPVAGVVVARHEEEALRLANASRFGLGASVWSADGERAERLARRLETGVVYVNDLVKSDPRLPFGGVKKSGYGRELAAFGIREFTNVKSIVVS